MYFSQASSHNPIMNLDPRYRTLFAELISSFSRSLVRLSVFTHHDFAPVMSAEEQILSQRRQDIQDILNAMAIHREECKEYINAEIHARIPILLLDFEFSYEERLKLLETIKSNALF